MNETEFKLPFMVLHRGDLEEKNGMTLEEIRNLSNEQMQKVADKLSSVLMHEWDECLSIALKEVQE